MWVIVVSHILGTFLGDSRGVVHRLEGGSEWEQTGNTKEYVYRERPECRVFRDRERLRIDVQGTSGVAEVREVHGQMVDGTGAF
jgi:hypothetical protein